MSIESHTKLKAIYQTSLDDTFDKTKTADLKAIKLDASQLMQDYESLDSNIWHDKIQLQIVTILESRKNSLRFRIQVTLSLLILGIGASNIYLSSFAQEGINEKQKQETRQSK